jgi:hypothetical protein
MVDNGRQRHVGYVGGAVRSSLLQILLMEPASQEKRHRLSELVREPRRTVQVTREEVIKKLKGIRAYSAAHVKELVAGLMTGLISHPEISCAIVRDDYEACSIITRIAGNRPIAVNRAAVIDNEIGPELVASGAILIDSYDGRLAAADNAVDRRAVLGSMTFESRFESIGKTIDLGSRRLDAITHGHTKDFVGLLGINAMSAQDGSIVMFQHTGNIGHLVEETADLILVAGLEKIVKDVDAAAFQTTCMAAFGSDALPLKGGTPMEGAVDFQSFLAGLPADRPAPKFISYSLIMGEEIFWKALFATSSCVSDAGPATLPAQPMEVTNLSYREMWLRT